MKESKRIIQLLEDIYKGKPWIDVNLTDTIGQINAKQASEKYSNLNSIWEIVNHLISWRLNVLDRVNGKVISSPSHNYFIPVQDTSEKAWQQTLQKLAATQEKWVAFLLGIPAAAFELIYPNNGHTYYKHIHGIIQHDAYHLGQIVLILKLQS